MVLFGSALLIPVVLGGLGSGLELWEGLGGGSAVATPCIRVFGQATGFGEAAVGIVEGSGGVACAGVGPVAGPGAQVIEIAVEVDHAPLTGAVSATASTPSR